MENIPFQVRQNASEYSDFVKDLGKWEKEMKHKENQKKAANISSKDIPPPRKTVKSQCASAKGDRIKAYDYRAWDKLDVDKMLEDIDYDEQSGVRLVELEESQDEQQDQEPNETLALTAKDKGNELFKRGDLKGAAEKYSESIKFDKSLCVAYTNRAMCYLKLKNYPKVIEDCDMALSLEPKNVKALWRRGLANEGLEKLQSALADVEKASVLEPTNSSIKADLDRIAVLLGKKKPERRRLEIEEIGDASKFPKSKQEIILQPKVEKQIFKAQDATPIFKAQDSNSNSSKESNPISSKESNPISSKESNSISTKELSQTPTLKDQNVSIITPKSFFEFERDWRSFKSSPNLQYEYLKSCVSEHCLANIIRRQLPSELFSSILVLLQSHFLEKDSPETCLNLLESVATADRLDMILMFLSRDEKKTLSQILDKLSSGNGDKERVAVLKSKFKV